MRNDLRGRFQQIVGFVHKSSRSTNGTSEPVQHTWQSEKNASSISHLEIVSAGDHTHQLIVVHQNGYLRGLSHDLQKEQWTASIEGENTVEYAFIQDGGEAKQGFLKNRADLIMSLETSVNNGVDLLHQTAIIGLITRSDKDQKRTLHVFAVKPPSVESAVHVSSRVQPLVQWHLPTAVGESEKNPLYSFDKASGLLFVVQKTTLATYTFTTVGPRLLNQLSHLPESPVLLSFIPLPRSLSLVMSLETCNLLDTHYNSILASTTTSSVDTAPPPSKRRKLEPTKTNPSSNIQLVEYFRSLNIAIAVKDNALLAFQLRFPIPVRGRASAKPSAAPRLIDSLGRGIPSTSNTTAEKAFPAIDAYMIDELARFDPSLAVLGHVFVDVAQENQGTYKSREYVNLKGLVQSLKWILRSFSTPPTTGQDQAQLTNGELMTALVPNGINGTAKPPATAVVSSDASEVSFLAEVSAATADLSLAVALISSASATTSESTPTDPVTLRAMTLECLLTKLGTSHPAAPLSRTLRAQLSQHDLFLLIELLRHALEQGGWASKVLDVYPDVLDPEDDMEGQIQEQERIDSGGLDSSVRVIGTLISCAVDALGAGAWLSGGIDVDIDSSSDDDDDDDDDNDNKPDNHEMMNLDKSTPTFSTRPLLPTLRHLTTTVLEVTQEAAFFHSFLADFLRYADTLAAAPKGVQNRLANAMANDQQGTGQGGMLPFGVRAARGIEATVVKAGGEVRVRSKREIAGRIAREVGAYGFERVRV